MTRQPPAPPGRYDFGLSSADETRAATLHNQSIVFDWLSQHVGGSNIFEHYSPELQAEFYRDLPNFSRGLVKRGCSEEQVKGILGENALRVFAEVCG